jgi:hypothetical protein
MCCGEGPAARGSTVRCGEPTGGGCVSGSDRCRGKTASPTRWPEPRPQPEACPARPRRADPQGRWGELALRALTRRGGSSAFDGPSEKGSVPSVRWTPAAQPDTAAPRLQRCKALVNQVSTGVRIQHCLRQTSRMFSIRGSVLAARSWETSSSAFLQAAKRWEAGCFSHVSNSKLFPNQP